MLHNMRSDFIVNFLHCFFHAVCNKNACSYKAQRVIFMEYGGNMEGCKISRHKMNSHKIFGRPGVNEMFITIY